MKSQIKKTKIHFRSVVLISCFCAIGYSARQLINTAVGSSTVIHKLVALVICNALGSLLLGIVNEKSKHNEYSTDKPLGVGLCGSLTSFSSWILQCTTILFSREYSWVEQCFFVFIAFVLTFSFVTIYENGVRISQEYYSHRDSKKKDSSPPSSINDREMVVISGSSDPASSSTISNETPDSLSEGYHYSIITLCICIVFVLVYIVLLLIHIFVYSLSNYIYGILFSIAGGLTRFYFSHFFNTKTFPYGTFFANLVATILCSCLYVYSIVDDFLVSLISVLFINAYCGSLSTMSTFVKETLDMKRQSWLLYILYFYGSLLLSFICSYLFLYLCL